MKIGIMGGTFDPIHNGHIHIALAAFDEYKLDKVWFMPAGDPYFKQGQGVSSPSVRLEMTQLAVNAYHDKFECSDIEIKAEGPTYSAETFVTLHKLYPEDEFYFIIGFDSLKSLASWYHPEILFKQAIILCALRDRGTIAEAKQIAEELKSDFKTSEPDIRLIHTPLIDISSTMVRKKENVALYIDIHKMYKNRT